MGAGHSRRGRAGREERRFSAGAGAPQPPGAPPPHYPSYAPTNYYQVRRRDGSQWPRREESVFEGEDLLIFCTKLFLGGATGGKFGGMVRI